MQNISGVVHVQEAKVVYHVAGSECDGGPERGLPVSDIGGQLVLSRRERLKIRGEQ